MRTSKYQKRFKGSCERTPYSGCDPLSVVMVEAFPLEAELPRGLAGRLRVPLGGDGPTSIRDSGLSSRRCVVPYI